MKTQTLILALAAVVFSTGCATMKSRFDKLPQMASLKESVSNGSADRNDESPEYQAPKRMLAIWKDSVRTENGKPAMRGFGGRIYLYDQNEAAIRAKGDLVIYGFDDSVKDREGSKADQRIVISNDKLQKLYSESALGPSYSVWFDWDEVGGPEKSVTLVPFFRTPEGEIIKAGQSIYTLHSPKKDPLHKEKLVSYDAGSQSDGQSVSHANYVQSGDEKNAVVQASGLQQLSEAKKSVRTTTIVVPKETQQRLRESSFGKNSSQTFAGDESGASEVSGRKERTVPSRLEAARKERAEQIKNGNVFGMPGQL